MASWIAAGHQFPGLVWRVVMPIHGAGHCSIEPRPARHLARAGHGGWRELMAQADAKLLAAKAEGRHRRQGAAP